jgi:hypothetical protein
MIADMEEQIDRAAGVGVGGEPFTVPVGLEMNNGGPGGKDTPVDGVGEGLLLGKCEPGAEAG